MRFCPSGESARTLFKSSESKSTLTNKQNCPHADCLTVPPRGPIPLATSVRQRIFFHFCLTTASKQLCRRKRDGTSERIAKLNFGSLGGGLEGESRRSSLRKFARARHSVRKQVAPRFKNGLLLKRLNICLLAARLMKCQI